MNEDVNPSLGISRRDLLRRGAVVGGTMMWAAPAVQTISRSALAQEAGTPLEDGEGAISYVAMVLVCDLPGGGTETVKVKFEADSGWEDDPGQTPACMEPAAWDAARAANGGELGIIVSGSTDQFCFDLSDTDPACRFEDGTSMGAAGDDHPKGKGFCTGPDAGWTSTFVCFTDPDA